MTATPGEAATGVAPEPVPEAPPKKTSNEPDYNEIVPVATRYDGLGELILEQPA
jgi:hypothetical protein